MSELAVKVRFWARVFWPAIRAFVFVSGSLFVFGLALFTFLAVRDSLNPPFRMITLSAGNFIVGSDSQIQTIEKISVRDGCIGQVSRALARVVQNPLDPKSELVDEQLITNASFVIGVTVDEIKNGAAGAISSSSRQSDGTHIETYRFGIPTPTTRQPGEWRFIYTTSYQPCGWGRGFLPISTETILGPVFLVKPLLLPTAPTSSPQQYNPPQKEVPNHA